MDYFSKVPPEFLHEASAASYAKSSSELPLQYSTPSKLVFEPEQVAHLLQELNANKPATLNTKTNFFIFKFLKGLKNNVKL